VPIVFTSALTGQRVRKCLDLVVEVQEQRLRRIDTHEVNEVLGQLLDRQPPPTHRGRRVKIRYATQIGVRPPTFAVFCNFPKALADHYIRFLHNGFREAWTFMGSPIRLRVRGGKDSRQAQ
jgi:GTP-binding protein